LLINNTHLINITGKNIIYWKSKNYKVKILDIIKVQSDELPLNSHEKVTLKCDLCLTSEWKTTKQRSHHVPKHRCRTCISKNITTFPEVARAQLTSCRKRWAMEGAKALHSARMSGNKNPMFAKPPKWGRHLYKGIYFRSTWEQKFAIWLDSLEIIWEFEPLTFRLNEHSTYTPDFYLPEFEQFIEIKGWLSDKGALQIKLFKELHPHLKYLVAFQKELKEIGVL
jgi:hypothetical protein